MAITHPLTTAPPPSTWTRTAPHVKKALQFIQSMARRQKGVTAEELVRWDFTHGKRLFNWSDPSAAHEWRVQQARVFLNTFQRMFENTRVRLVANMPADVEVGRPRAYFHAETISKDPRMREQIIESIAERMANLAKQLRMWKLTAAERTGLIRRLEAALG